MEQQIKKSERISWRLIARFGRRIRGERIADRRQGTRYLQHGADGIAQERDEVVGDFFAAFHDFGVGEFGVGEPGGLVGEA